MFELNLSSCVPGCSQEELNPFLVDRLQYFESLLSFRPTYTSAYRSQGWERSKGRKGDSSHCKGLAVDISARDSHTRYLIVKNALLCGFSRIGIGKYFVHLDLDETKAHHIIFHYYD